MFKLYVFVFYICLFQAVNSVYYDAYRSVRITYEELLEYKRANTTSWCVVDIKLPCDADEGRRIDGSCAHLNKPTSGSPRSRVRRLLPAYFSGSDDEVTETKSGDPLPLPRVGRTTGLPAGKMPSLVFTQLFSYFVVHIFSNVGSAHDTFNYLFEKTYCCEPKGKSDYECAPNPIPIDDPVHRFSGIRCMNQTRPRTYQFKGCAPKNTTPMRILTSSPLFDLSDVYGNSLALLNKSRTFNHGQLKTELDAGGRIWPPSLKRGDENFICVINQLPQETRCHDVPVTGNNGLLGLNVFLVWSWRHHNKIAKRLAALNPCWNDEKLFYTARDINIAYTLQVFYYEFLTQLFGKKNTMNTGLTSPDPGFRDIYRVNVQPQISVEFTVSMRWFHTIQEGTVKMFDAEGYYLKEFPMVNMSLRTGYIANNIDYITQGSFRQRGGNHDHMMDPDLTERGTGPIHRAADLGTSDLHKNRLFFLQPYVKYLELCTGKSFKKFEDLEGFMDKKRIELLKTLYPTVEDIDFMMGLWQEKYIVGGHVPQTFYCIVVDQFYRNIVSDRHWYERPNRPNAFTPKQLGELRKASMAEWLCDVGDKVSEIQRRPFLVAGAKNKIVSCKKIKKVDYSVWKDSTCKKENTEN